MAFLNSDVQFEPLPKDLESRFAVPPFVCFFLGFFWDGFLSFDSKHLKGKAKNDRGTSFTRGCEMEAILLSQLDIDSTKFFYDQPPVRVKELNFWKEKAGRWMTVALLLP